MLNHPTGVNAGTSPILPRHPLDQPDVVKIALGESASEALRSLGKYVLVMASPADATLPQAAQGRYILHCIPLTKELADAAYQVTAGKMKAVKSRTRDSPPRIMNSNNRPFPNRG